jgi:hydrogenase nickel incorporation protein HypA/HybF
LSGEELSGPSWHGEPESGGREGRLHELSIAQSVLELVAEHVPAARRPDVRVVTVRVGSLSGVVPESLKFCFEACVADTPLAGARLEIQRQPIRLSCTSCRSRFSVHEPLFRCPDCGEPSVKLVGGAELEVTEVELEERVVEGA